MTSNKGGKYLGRVMVIYLFVCLGLVLLSLLGLIWNDWEVIVSVVSGSIFGALNLLLLIKSAGGINPDENEKKSTISIFAALGAVRFVFMILALGLPLLIIWLTMPDPVNKVRYYNIIAAGLPFVFTAIVTALVKPDDDPSSKQDKETKK